MRIRSIKPDFWRSQAISALDWDTRLLFIGLWSYVDDNGVGIDRLSLITTDLFADDVEREPSETFARVSRGLASLSDAGRILRYANDDRDYLEIVNWNEHQKIDRPGKERYPRSTSEDTAIRETLAKPSRDTRETLATGEGEKGRRGEGEKAPERPDADADPPPTPDPTEPPRRCPKHEDVDDPPPCGGCAEARKRNDRWNLNRAKAEQEAANAAATERRAAEALARTEGVALCGLCGDDGYRGSAVCDHVDRTETHLNGIAKVRAAIGKGES